MPIANTARQRPLKGTSVYELFQTALRKPRGPVEGPLVKADDGACVRFRVEWTAGTVATVHYQSTTCATLIALCELISRLACGLDRQAASALDAATLLAHLPEIPASHQDRAFLAARAFHAALSIE